MHAKQSAHLLVSRVVEGNGSRQLLLHLGFVLVRPLHGALQLGHLGLIHFAARLELRLQAHLLAQVPRYSHKQQGTYTSPPQHMQQLVTCYLQDRTLLRE